MDWFNQLESRINLLLADPVFLQWGFLIGLAILIFILALLILGNILQRLNPVKGRIEILVKGDRQAAPQPIFDNAEATRTQRLLERLGRGLSPTEASKGNKVADRLNQIGYRTQHHLHVFYAFKILCAVGLPLLVGLFTLTYGMPLGEALPYILLAAPLGLILPDYWLTKTLKKRQTVLRKSLPDALDMLVVCAEAGLGLNAAIQRVAMELDIQHPLLSEELKTTMLHMGAGMDSRTALQELANRTGMDEMRSLVATLQQAMRFGTSISETLRAFAEDMRNKRLEAAQEQAAKVGVRMLIPIALCMLPAVMLVVMGPPMIQLMGSLSGQ